jgi:MFS family permease
MTPKASRWGIAFLLAAGVFVNYLDRVNLTVAHGALANDFHLRDVAFGWLLSTYNFTYALCQIPMGVLLDRFGVRRLGILSAALVSLASFMSALSPVLWILFFSRLVLGVGESPLFPGNAKAVGLWFPVEERGRATSWFDSMAKLASGIGVPLLGYLLLRTGWRMSFTFTALCTLAYLAAFARWYRDPPLRSVESEKPASRPKATYAAVAALMAQPKVAGMAAIMLAYNYFFYLTLTWLPTILVRKLHINFGQAFLLTAVPWLFATVAEIAIGGYLTDWLVKRQRRPARIRVFLVAGGLACGVSQLAMPAARTPVIAILLVTLAIAGNAAVTPSIWAAPSLIASSQSEVATVGGIMNLSGQIGGISAPIVTGYIVSGTGSFDAGFVVAALLLLGGVVSCFVLVKELTPMREAQGMQEIGG